MAVLQGHQLSFQLDNGSWLFQRQDIQLQTKLTALIGDNGIGKSVLLSVLAGLISPSSGRVYVQGRIGIYQQQTKCLFEKQQTIAQFLSIADKLTAIDKITQGYCQQHWFDCVGDDWHVGTRTVDALADSGLILAAHQSLNSWCTELSGGQQALLRLYKLFSSDADILLLDEPSNHLDATGRQWLIQLLQQFSGKILMISHDRMLLDQVSAIYQLSCNGLEYFCGNYQAFYQQQQCQQAALQKKALQIIRQQKQLANTVQANYEKAQQRAAQGKKQRKQGSQPKVAIDAKKNKAGQQLAARLKNAEKQAQFLSKSLSQIQAEKIQPNQQSLTLMSATPAKQKTLLSAQNVATIPRLFQPISFQLTTSNRCHLMGANGVGKSSLLRLIHSEKQTHTGDIIKNCQTLYLDQHFTLLDGEQSVLANLASSCPQLAESEARTLLAGIGFKGASVFGQAQHLSGGEKTKLLILMVSHLPDSPLLLLDEPDNHLDIASKQRLAAALAAYRGAFILVSHDPWFVRDVGIDFTIECQR